MKPAPLSRRDRLELALIRVLSTLLAGIDRALNMSWGERLVNRLTRRWESQLSRLQADLVRLESERTRLQSQAEALAIHAATIYLGGRSLIQGDLCFDPADPSDEKLLDATVDLLVKARLATIERRESDSGGCLYSVEPNWPAIRERLAVARDQAEPSVAPSYAESVRFIDETFLHPPRP